MERQELLQEVQRVAAELSKPVASLTRREFVGASPSGYRFERFGSWVQIRALAANDTGEPDHGAELLEREGTRQQVAYTRKLERRVGRAEWFSERLDRCVASHLEQNPIKLPERRGKWKDTNPAGSRMLTLLWSDLHFGVDVSPTEILGSEYDYSIGRKRLMTCVDHAAGWKARHRDRTRLKLLLNGDIIEGVIHRDDSGVRGLADQLVEASRILVDAIDQLRDHFRVIEVHCMPGNHGRDLTKSKGRQTSQRWDNHERAIYLALQMAFRHASDVVFDIPPSGLAGYTTPGEHLIVASHGDTEPGPGNIGRSVNTGKMQSKLYGLDAAKVFDRPISVLAFGHWHTPFLLMLPNGSRIVVNGSLVGGSSFTQNGVGIYGSTPAQVMFESTEKHALGDFRIVDV